MTTFGELPNETLLQIIKETSAGDVAALASCCKNLHLLAQGRLAYHREKRRAVEDLVVGWDMWETSAVHPLKHLQDILEDDDSRFYTRVLNIGTLDDGDPENDRAHKRAEAVLLADIKSRYGCQISAIVAKVYNALLPHAAKTDLERWTKHVKEGEEPAAVVILLLALYPNLEDLYIYEPGQEWWRSHKLGNLFRSLTKTAMDPATNKLRIFNRLSKFHLFGIGDDGGAEANALMAAPFMALPTMRKICGCNADGRDIYWPYGTGASNVTELDLQVRTSPAHHTFFQATWGQGILSRDSRALPESMMLTWRYTAGRHRHYQPVKPHSRCQGPRGFQVSICSASSLE